MFKLLAPMAHYLKSILVVYVAAAITTGIVGVLAITIIAHPTLSVGFLFGVVTGITIIAAVHANKISAIDVQNYFSKAVHPTHPFKWEA